MMTMFLFWSEAMAKERMAFARGVGAGRERDARCDDE